MGKILGLGTKDGIKDAASLRGFIQRPGLFEIVKRLVEGTKKHDPETGGRQDDV